MLTSTMTANSNHTQLHHTAGIDTASVQDWLQTLVSSLPNATLMADKNRRIIVTNQQFCDLFHLPQAAEALTGYNTMDLLKELSHTLENPQEVAARVEELYTSCSIASNDEVRMKDGRILLRDHRPIYLKEQFIGHLWSFSDETEKINTARLIQEQKKFYEDILNHVPADIAVFSPSHHYLYLNPIAIRDEELRRWLIGKTDADYCLYRGKDMSLAEKRQAIFKKIIDEKRTHTWEEKVVNRKGEEEYHLRRMSPIYDEAGKLKLLIGYGLNITEQKKIEEQGKLSERRYKDLFNYSQAFICTHDLQGRLLEANPALCEAMETTPEEIIGRNLKSLLPAEDQPLFDSYYLPALRHHKKVKGLFCALKKSGRQVYLLYQNYKVELPGQEPYVVAFAQDVTDRIRAERQLKEAKKVTEETARAKEKFLANMSHEIRTPMNGILGITALLQKTRLNNEQQSFLQMIQDSAQNLLNIINDILDLEKIRSGEIVLEKIEFDIAAKLQSAIQLFQVEADRKNLRLVFDSHIGNRFAVTGDPTRFTQILNNLLSNAIKFTPAGTITLYAGIEHETEQEVLLHFYVQDSGIGIEESKLIKIFQPFTQAYAETTRKYGGTGLGLAITKNLIELQNGQIWVESEVKNGSTFHFTIRYAKASVEKLQPAGNSNEPVHNKLGKLKILLAEDNEINLLLARSILQYWGFEARVAVNGNEVIDLMQQEDFDIVLMDIQMPEKSGIDAAREIRAMTDPVKNKIPIIALTANALKGEEQKYFAVGMNDYLTKPFTEKELYAVIDRVYQPK